MSVTNGQPLMLVDVVEEMRSAGVAIEIAGDTTGVTVASVTHDSRAAGHGTLFACVPGGSVDGHDFAKAAVDAGAGALLVERRLDPATVGEVPQLIVDDARRRLGPVAAFVSGRPSRAMTSVGITGTNGKTTTSLMLASIFEAHGWGTGIIGTLSHARTTPEAPDLQRQLADFVDDGLDATVLEVSSHALALHRVDGTEFDAVVFTNFGRDHLDLHGTPEEYFRAKASLFSSRFAPFGVINADDTHGRLLIDTLAGNDDDFRVVPYSVDDLDDLVVTATTIAYTWRQQPVQVGIGGQFNVANSLAALVTATELGIAPEVAASGLRSLGAVPGRFETVTWDGPFAVVVDYAHTPDGIAEVTAAARTVIAPDARVIVVFGCGGDRDRDKRPEMGAAAAVGADAVVITSDNPRSEDPGSIIDDIVEGVAEHYRDRITCQADRRAAIGEALALARPGDIVVIAGKGHERTQDLGSNVIDFDDRVVARSFLEELS